MPSPGLAELPEADLRVRAEIDAQAASGGWAAVHRELERVDPQAAARIHSNELQRIQRALEVYWLLAMHLAACRDWRKLCCGWMCWNLRSRL